MNFGWKSSKQAINYERGESSAVLGSAEIRCMPNATGPPLQCVTGEGGISLLHIPKKVFWYFGLGQHPRIVSEIALTAWKS